jgi:ornithine cyclodeaminase/alanine dehydrogenase-like protein (mu-crystallin family)
VRLLEDPLEVEAALVAGRPVAEMSPAALGAVASRYLAVGTPRSFAIIGPGIESLAAHRTWFAPRDIRCTLTEVAEATGGRVVTLEEALGADIVCVHERITIEQLRRGTHVNALVEIAWRATGVELTLDLRPVAAGLVDGRQLDEITAYIYSL